MILLLKRIQIYVHIHIWKIIFSCMCDSNIRIEWLLREHIYIRSAMDMDMDMDMEGRASAQSKQAMPLGPANPSISILLYIHVVLVV